ncbi:MAG: right-handed parallel beta-helix repeat-containing protein [Planctomycetota bacterium]
MRTSARLAVLIAVCTCTSAAEGVPLRIGDAGSLPDPSRFDPAYPEMERWAKAGVEGGIPYIERVVGRIDPETDIVAAVAAAAGQVSAGNPGVLLLAAGDYPIPRELWLKPGLILRGADRTQTFLISELNEMKAPYGVAETHAIKMAERSALEDLTVYNRHVKDKDPGTYVGKYSNPGAPCSGLVKIPGKATNSWIQRCNLTHAGSNPISIDGDHITIRDCTIEHAYNKGGKGHGYLELGNAHDILFYNITVTDIRHVSVMWKSSYVVFYECDFTIDINYHDGLPHHNLIEACTFRPQRGHHWGCIAYGAKPWQDCGPGPRCLFWNNDMTGKNSGWAGSQVVWELEDTTPGYDAMGKSVPDRLEAGPPPKHGTLYAVTGKDIPLEMVERGRCMANLEAAIAAEAHAKVIFFARLGRGLFKQDSPEYAEATRQLERTQQAASSALGDLGDDPDADELRSFLATWEGTDAHALADRLASADFARIAPGGRTPRGSRLRDFVDDWHGVATIDAAMRAYQQQADEDFEREQDDFGHPDDLRKFIAKWRHAEAAERAGQRLVALLRKALDKLDGMVDKMNRRQREETFQLFVDTSLEAEARALLIGD